MAQQAASRQPFSRNAMALGPPKKQTLPKYPSELDEKVRAPLRAAGTPYCAVRCSAAQCRRCRPAQRRRRRTNPNAALRTRLLRAGLEATHRAQPGRTPARC